MSYLRKLPSYAWLEFEFIVLAVQVAVNPLAVLIVPTEKSVNLPPTVPVVKVVVANPSPSPELGTEFCQLVAGVGTDTNESGLLQATFDFGST